jgi:mevalonate kinase
MASAGIGTSAATALSIARAFSGVPMPMVSPSEIS